MSTLAAPSASKTERRPSPPETPIQYVKGVGPRLGAILSSRGLATVSDLLRFFPRAYEDRSRFHEVGAIEEGATATVSVRVRSTRRIPLRAQGRSILEAVCEDAMGGRLSLKWFHPPKGIEQRLKPGTPLVATGRVKHYRGAPEIAHPELTWNAGPALDRAVPTEPAMDSGTAESQDFGRIVPIYVELEGIPTRYLRKILWEAVEKFAATLPEDLPSRILEARGLPKQVSAIREIHFPPEDATLATIQAFDTPAHRRLIYEEFLKFELVMIRGKLRAEQRKARSFAGGTLADLRAALPFRLTRAQEIALAEILADLAREIPMNRLVQGDVGSGKTVVAMLAAGTVLGSGGQAALMAPTEILVSQHFATAERLFSGRLPVALLTGSTPQSERARLGARLAAGEPLLVFGTHALIEPWLAFRALDLVMIDEQHRFGVDQRRQLRAKGEREGLVPHSLILTATPIPRTLALTAYGDLGISAIRELPPGRSPVITRVVPGKRDAALAEIRARLAEGRQAYFIYPLVTESEAEGFASLKSAEGEAERLAREVFPGIEIALLHGRMKSDEKAAAMARFQSGGARVLVSTTVVEVGVDVPNATVMVVEHAERFGLSQLHQLRGRVGRGAHQSYCYLFTHPRAATAGEPNGASAERLAILEKSTDGFEIAEEDLRLRGPGEFLGTRQAGSLPFRMADLVRDREWLILARDDAMAILRQDPELQAPENIALRQYFEREGRLHGERLRAS